ncbi:MAG: ATP-binding cassette domain-containing protein [Alphaproteobacteria bacterium]
MNDARPAGASGPLEVSIARKAYRTASGEHVDVLHNVGFSMRDREVLALVGPSGCGKTTLLRIVAGLDHDFEGSVTRPPGVIGMVFQEPRLLPWRSVEDNVRLAAPHADDAALGTLFEMLDLSAHRGHFPGELSLGLARRVALARAFAVEPTLLILDEPFTSLDAPLAARLRDELTLLVARRPVTTLLVTHDLDEAAQLADRFIALSARPARVLAEIPVSGRRGARDENEIAAAKAGLIRWLNT